jgi:addiction module HigA family antidote
MEHLSERQLAHHIRHRKRGNLQSQPGGLPLMGTTPKKSMTPPQPGEFIRDEIFAELNLTVGQAAKVLGVRRATLSDLVNAKAGLSPEMALRIEKAFDVSMDMLLRIQAWHDASTMRRRTGEIKVRRYKPTAALSRG